MSERLPKRECSSVEKEQIRARLLSSGAIEVGFSSSEGPDDEEIIRFDRWVAAGKNAGMSYMERHASLRKSLENVLPGTASVISMAFSHVPEKKRNPGLPTIARYAYGDDYHEVIRKRVAPLLRELSGWFPGEEFRLCIDSAPVAERYWALKAGIGVRGLNGSVIVRDSGCFAFLAEILTTVVIPPDEPSERVCLRCGACFRACPTSALDADGIDCNRCLSYLTIEHRGEWTPEMKDTILGGGEDVLFGCDLCLSVCPHNRQAIPTEIAEFRLREGIVNLSKETIEGMSDEEIRKTIAGSPLKRAKPEGLRRNSALKI